MSAKRVILPGRGGAPLSHLFFPRLPRATVAPTTANRIRIIGGAWRRRIVRFPGTAGVRPTPDRVRETLFNWLGQDLTGWRCLDLYAGTGALSLEAASRGAALAVAVDRSRTLIDALRTSGRELGASALETHVADARTHLATESRSFDLVFLDPPYADDPWTWLLPACARRLASGGFVYAEADHELEPPAGLDCRRRDRAGLVHYHLFAAAGTLRGTTETDPPPS
jgi:16S rRNA (guanine(966)-N(2))-methyltransferase RsmD